MPSARFARSSQSPGTCDDQVRRAKHGRAVPITATFCQAPERDTPRRSGDVGEQSGPTLIQSVQRALRLLEVVAERDGRAPAKELARATGLAAPDHLPPAAHPDPRGLPAAPRRRVVRARPPDRRRPQPRDGGPGGRARPSGAGVAARRALQRGLPRPPRRRRDRRRRDHRQPAGAAHRPLGRDPPRRPRHGAGQVDPRPADRCRTGRTIWPGTRCTISPRAPSSTVDGSATGFPLRTPSPSTTRSTPWGSAASPRPVTTVDGVGALGVVTSPGALRRPDVPRQTLRACAARVSRALTIE